MEKKYPEICNQNPKFTQSGGEHINLRQEFIFKKSLNMERGEKQIKEGDQYVDIFNTILITANINAINVR